MSKRILALVIAITIMTVSFPVSAAYANYTYDVWGDAYIEPDSYVAEMELDGSQIGVGHFSTPKDLFAAEDGQLYIADTGNHRIVILNSDFSLNRVIASFTYKDNEEKFNQPSGVFVDKEGRLFVADTENHRIVVFNFGDECIAIYDTPEKMTELTDFEYRPIRISVDSAGRIFVVSQDLSKGMLELDSQGNFVSFFGATSVKENFVDLIWSRLLTREQKDNDSHSQPTEYSANDIDEDGFVYGTISAKLGYSVSIRRLNPMGEDVLRRMGNQDPVGDLDSVATSGSESSTQFIDICVHNNGSYSALDQLRGRVFTYDSDGNLLYVFGGIGQQQGEVTSPKAIERLSDGRFVVLDGGLQQLIFYKPTEYALWIEKAVTAQDLRQYKEAENYWRQILTMTTNSELAYVGVGKALFRQGSYKQAMEYFKLGNNREWYSKAFKEYRREALKEGFTYIIWGVVVLAGGVLAFKVVRKIRKRGRMD